MVKLLLPYHTLPVLPGEDRCIKKMKRSDQCEEIRVKALTYLKIMQLEKTPFHGHCILEVECSG